MPDSVPAGAPEIALPVVSSLAADAFDAAMKSVWEFAAGFLTAAFTFIDKFTTPDLDPSTGPITTVLPTVGWIAGVVASIAVFVQIGAAAITRGTGLARLAVGVGQYVLVTACGYAVLVAGVTAATGLTHGILTSALDVDNWAGINGSNNAPFILAVQADTGVQLGLVAISCVIPAAAGYLIEAMIRAAALLILAATMPILAAGLLSEKTASWFWKGLRWTIALLMLQPVTALVVAIGFNIASGAAGGAPGTGSSTDALGTLLIGGVTLLVSLICPFALFKLLAFIDPATPSGSAVRASTAGGSQRSRRPATPTQSSPATGPAASETATSGRFAAALGKAGPYAAAAVGALQVAHAVGARTVGAADHVLSAAGAGHHGGGTSALPGGPASLRDASQAVVNAGNAAVSNDSAPQGAAAPLDPESDEPYPPVRTRASSRSSSRSRPASGRRHRSDPPMVPPPPLAEPQQLRGIPPVPPPPAAPVGWPDLGDDDKLDYLPPPFDDVEQR